MQMQQVSKSTSANSVILRGIVNDLIYDAAPLAVNNRNFVINNVSADLQTEINGTIVSSVLSKLFHTVIRHSQNSGILISAKLYGIVILLQIKINGNINPDLLEDIEQATLNAQNAGGVIEVIHHANNQASVAYCFLNVASAA
jgi:hypothetical protein